MLVWTGSVKYNLRLTLENAVEMGQKKNMAKDIKDGTEDTRAAGKSSSCSSLSEVR